MSQPWGHEWRSSPSFITAMVGMSLFTDLFLYAIVVPILPFILQDRFQMPDSLVQSYTSGLLAVYAGASVILSVPSGWLASKVGPRQLLLVGLLVLYMATAMFAFSYSISLLVIARLFQGLSTAVVWTAGLAMVQDAVEPSEMGTVLGTIFSFVSVGQLSAPVAGGILYDKGGMKAVFGAAATLFTVDLAMRILSIGGKVPRQNGHLVSEEQETDDQSPVMGQDADENSALLVTNLEEYVVHGEPGPILRSIPILYCFQHSRFRMGMLLSFAQALLMGAFDATIPTEAARLFHFSSSQVGLLFIALTIPFMAAGPAAGRAVDRHGTRAVAVTGYAFLVPCLILLMLPELGIVGGTRNILLFCVLLAANGVGLCIVSSPGPVEAINIATRYEAANPQLFANNGTYAQLFGFNSLFYSTGLTFGPILAGMLQIEVGFGWMCIVFGLFAGIMAILLLWVLKPRK